jgi:hypothetical protein
MTTDKVMLTYASEDGLLSGVEVDTGLNSDYITFG